MIRELGVKAGVSLNPATPLGQCGGDPCCGGSAAHYDGKPWFWRAKVYCRRTPQNTPARELINVTASDVLIEVDGGVTLDNMAAISRPGQIFLSPALLFSDRAITRRRSEDEGAAQLTTKGFRSSPVAKWKSLVEGHRSIGCSP